MSDIPKYAHASTRPGFEPGGRMRRATSAVLKVQLPPEIAMAIFLTARQAGLSPENLVADILRDMFEPTFAGRGELAVKESGPIASEAAA